MSDVDHYGMHLVDWASLKVMLMMLLAMFQGRFVPVMVKLSPPRRFSCVVGTIKVAVQLMTVAASDALLFTKPYLETSLGK